MWGFSQTRIFIRWHFHQVPPRCFQEPPLFRVPSPLAGYLGSLTVSPSPFSGHVPLSGTLRTAPLIEFLFLRPAHLHALAWHFCSPALLDPSLTTAFIPHRISPCSDSKLMPEKKRRHVCDVWTLGFVNFPLWQMKMLNPGESECRRSNQDALHTELVSSDSPGGRILDYTRSAPWLLPTSRYTLILLPRVLLFCKGKP